MPASTAASDRASRRATRRVHDADAAAAASPGRAAAPAGPRKGRHTRAAILDAALRLSAQVGLEGLSIGALAELMQMSKSGVFAHFGSREELQISVIREYHQRFEAEVFVPALDEARGLPRLRMMIDRWARRVALESDAGCIYISGAVEFDDRPGPVRDALAQMASTWHAALERAIRLAIEVGHLDTRADPSQMLFEIHGLILALHYHARFMRSADAVRHVRLGLQRILADHGAVAPARSSRTPARAAPARARMP